MARTDIIQTAPGIRGHVREIVALGLPLVLSQLAQIALQVTDTLMLGWYDVEALAGLVLATGFIIIAIVTGGGFAGAVMPMVASAAGTENDRQVRRVTRMGLWLSVIFGVAAMPAMLLAEPILLAMGQAPGVSDAAGRYLWVAGWGVFPSLLFLVVRAYLAGLGRTTSVLVATLGMVAANIPLNYALIFGNWGAPEMGVVGAAWASLLSSIAGMVALVVHALRATPEYDLFRNLWRPDWEVFGRVARLGLPMGVTHLAEVGFFTFAAILMGWVGTLELAAHGIAIQIAATTFMLQYGLSQAATVRAGRAYGRSDAEALRTGALVATGLAGVAALVIIVVFLVIPETLIGLFLDPADPDRAAIIAIGVTLLALAALFQIVDGAQVMAIGLLRGVQDAKVPMILAAISYWVVGAPACYLLGFPLGFGAVGVWTGLVIGLGAAAALLSWRFWVRASRLV